MAFPNDDLTVQHGDRTIQLIDWLVGRLEECLGEVLPLQTDDLLKDYAKDARNSMASAIEHLRLGRAKKEQQLGGTSWRYAHCTDSFHCQLLECNRLCYNSHLSLRRSSSKNEIARLLYSDVISITDAALRWQ